DSSTDQLILVDSFDNEIGYESVTGCHYGNPKLHRAFSVFVFNDAGEMLITQRSSEKHTWPLFWSNACCSHARKGQDSEAAAGSVRSPWSHTVVPALAGSRHVPGGGAVRQGVVVTFEPLGSSLNSGVVWNGCLKSLGSATIVKAGSQLSPLGCCGNRWKYSVI